MGQPDLFLQSNGVFFAQRDTRLVCLDRRSGKEKWVVRPQTLARAPDARGNQDKPDKLDRRSLQQLDLTGSPLVIGDNVYVAAHSGGMLQFEDCYVLCFDKDSGRFN